MGELYFYICYIIYGDDRHKSISGMSSLIISRIVRDFPNFSESELYRKVETSLLAIFNSLENGVVFK